MIGIKLEGDTDYLDTREDTSIDITLENPLLGDADRLSPGSYSLPFNLPGGDASPKNAKKLKNPDVLANNEAYAKQLADLFFDDIRYKSGILKSGSAKGNAIETYFTFGLNSLAPEMKTAKLRDLVNEDIIIDNSAITKKIYVAYSAGGTRAITVNGKEYSAADWSTIAIAINADADLALDSGKYMPYAQVVLAGGADSPNGWLSPEYIVIWLSLYYTYHDPELDMDFLLRQDNTDPLSELSVTVESLTNFSFDVFDMTGYYAGFQTFLAGYLNGVYPTEKFRFPLMFNANLHNGELLKFKEVINLSADGVMSTNDFLQSRAGNSVQPFVRLKWLLDKIADEYGFEWSGDFYDDAETAARLICNSVTLDVPQEFVYNRKFIFWKRSFNINELVPEISVVDFLKRICSRYNLATGVDEETGKVFLQYLEPVAKANDYEDITSISSPTDGNEDQRTTGFTLSCKKEETDAFSLDETLTVGDAEDTLEIGCGRLFQLTSDVIGGGLVSGPRVSVKNNDKFSLRIFHYKGFVDNGEFIYPAADINGTVTYEALNDFIVNIGLYNRFFKYWLLFEKNRRLIKLKVNWPLRQLLRFDWSLKRRFDRSNYLVKSVNVKMTNSNLKVSEVELITMK